MLTSIFLAFLHFHGNTAFTARTQIAPDASLPAVQCETVGPRLDGTRVEICNGAVKRVFAANGESLAISDYDR